MAELDPERALRAVGELLAYEGEEVAIVIIGGSALILLGLVERATIDVDVLAVRRDEAGAEDFGLPADWLNTMAGLQWRTGLPPGLEGRLEWREYGGLQVGLVSRHDLIFFKLYAAADDTGPDSVHYQDLIALGPSEEELNAAARWIASQDASKSFHSILEEVVSRLKADLRTDA